MIYFDRVTDQASGQGESPCILQDLSFRIPPGRYALLASDNALRKPVVDLLTGARPPTKGRVIRQGRSSWAICRGSFVRGRFTAYELIRLVARLYHLDRRLCEGIVADFITHNDLLDHSIHTWDSLSRMEIGLILALLPDFDIYVCDGVLPYRKGRFTTLWKMLFEQRVAGKTLIMSMSRAGDATEFCDKALIVDHGQIRISDQLERAIVDYPPRPTPDEPGPSPEPSSVDDGDVI